MKRFTTGITAASLFLVCSAAPAQEETPRTPNRNTQNPNTQRDTENRNTQNPNTQRDTENRNTQKQTTQNRNQQSGSQDEMKLYILGKLVLMNECEIQTSKLAQQKSSSQEVKEFARMLEQDHSKLNQRIREANPDFEKLIDQKQFQQTSSQEQSSQQQNNRQQEDRLAQNQATPGQSTPAQSTPGQTTPGRNNQSTPGRNNQTTPGQENPGETRTTQKATFPDNPEWEGKAVYHILKHDTEASKNFLKASLEMLEQEEGQDFDMAFLGMQIAGHTRALAELEAYDASGVRDQQVQQILREAKTGVQKHLEHAKQLAKKHEGQESRDTDTQTPNRSKRENPATPNRTNRENPTSPNRNDRENPTTPNRTDREDPTTPQRNPALPRSQPQTQPE